MVDGQVLPLGEKSSGDPQSQSELNVVSCNGKSVKEMYLVLSNTIAAICRPAECSKLATVPFDVSSSNELIATPALYSSVRTFKDHAMQA